MKIVIKNNSLVKDIGLEDFDEVTKSSKPYVVKFYSPTCHLCVALKPIYQKIANDFKDKFNFGTVNTKKQGALSRMFAIEGVPEIFIIFNSNILRLEYPQDASEVSGFTESHLITYLNSYIDNILNQEEGGC